MRLDPPNSFVASVSQAGAPKVDSDGEYLLVQAELPNSNLQNIGILLLDPGSDRLYCRFRRDFEQFAGEEEDWFRELPDYISQTAIELGGKACLQRMESTLSGTLRISTREGVAIEGSAAAKLEGLYAIHIRPKILEFRTHLPQYSLEAAAGKFGRHMAVEPEGWVEVFTDLRLTEDMFVVHVEGHSMEPKIPHASLCAFRSKIVDWDGKLLLIEDYSESGGGRYTVKLCHLSKAQDANQPEDEAWLHHRVTLKSINPAFKSWEVASAEKIRLLGEFLFVL
jgi:Peptidase S24-like